MDGSSTGTQTEALETLTVLVRRRFGRISPGRIAEHLIELMPDADWSILRAALDGLARRHGFARRDGLALSTKPKRGTTLGLLRTRSSDATGRSMRPYDAELISSAPLRMSCGCRDFLRSSLGLCKHGLVVLEALEVSGALSRVSTQSDTRAARALLTWDSYQPMTGSTDRLEPEGTTLSRAVVFRVTVRRVVPSSNRVSAHGVSGTLETSLPIALRRCTRMMLGAMENT